MTCHALKQYLNYRWKAKTRHGVHSPFVYSFIDNGLGRKEDLETIINSYFKDYNRMWLNDTRQLSIVDSKQDPGSLIVVKNIHTNEQADRAWQQAVTDKHVKLSIDLYQVGLLFFRDEFKEKQHFVLKFPL